MWQKWRVVVNMQEKGITLIEVLGFIILLGLFSLIIFPNIEVALKKGKDNADNKIAEHVVLAARSWAIDNKKQLPETNLKASVDLTTLQAGGYIEKTIKKPSTGEIIDKACVIITNKDDVYYYKYDETCINRPIYSKLTYDYKTNGGTSSNAVNLSKVLSGQKIDMSKTATKPGWVFVGWNTDKNAHTGLSKLSMPTKDVTLYAIFRKNSISYVLTTNGNGGIGTGYNSTCTIGAVYNNEQQLNYCNAFLPQNGFSRNGYSFNGWSIDRNASSGSNPDTLVRLYDNTTYYATWYQPAVYPSCSISISGTTKTVNGRSWYYVSGQYPKVTLTTTNASSYTFRDPKGSSILSKSTSLTYDVENGSYYATVRSSTGHTSTCSKSVYRDTQAPKMYLSIYNPQSLPTHGLDNSQYLKAVNSNLAGGTYKKGEIGYRIVVVDYIDPYADGPSEAESRGGYGSGYTGTVTMNYGSGIENISESYYDRSSSKSNYYGSRRTDHHSAFSSAGNRVLTFTARDNLGHSRTQTIRVNVTE